MKLCTLRGPYLACHIVKRQTCSELEHPIQRPLLSGEFVEQLIDGTPPRKKKSGMLEVPHIIPRTHGFAYPDLLRRLTSTRFICSNGTLHPQGSKCPITTVGTVDSGSRQCHAGCGFKVLGPHTAQERNQSIISLNPQPNKIWKNGKDFQKTSLGNYVKPNILVSIRSNVRYYKA